MPNEITSASESNSTPKALAEPVNRAMRPSSMSSTMLKPMKGAAVSNSPRHRVDNTRVAAEHVAQREERRQEVDATPEPPPPRLVGHAA